MGVTEGDDGPRDAESGEECGGELEAVVGVELQLWQQIRARDAEERAGAERESASQPGGVVVGPGCGPEIEERGADWGDEGEGEVDGVPGGTGGAAGRHESCDGHCAERFVEDDSEGRAQTQGSPVTLGACRHRGGHGQSVEYRVERETQRDAHPAETPGRALGQGVGMSTRFQRAAFGDVVMVKREEPLEQEHDEETGEHPRCGGMDGAEFVACVGEEAEEGQPEHEAGDETDGGLKAGVGEPDEVREGTAGDRRQQCQEAVAGKDGRRGGEQVGHAMWWRSVGMGSVGSRLRLGLRELKARLFVGTKRARWCRAAAHAATPWGPHEKIAPPGSVGGNHVSMASKSPHSAAGG